MFCGSDFVICNTFQRNWKSADEAEKLRKLKKIIRNRLEMARKLGLKSIFADSRRLYQIVITSTRLSESITLEFPITTTSIATL